jgi:hypothetical protein
LPALKPMPQFLSYDEEDDEWYLFVDLIELFEKRKQIHLKSLFS